MPAGIILSSPPPSSPSSSSKIVSNFHKAFVVSRCIFLFPPNTYNEFMVRNGDTLDLNYGHIIPKLIIQCLKNRDFELFGSLEAIREFIYVKDLARIMILAAIKVNKSSIFNVGSGESIKISKLVQIIKGKTKFKKKIINKSKIKDNSRRVCDSKNLKKEINYKIIYNLNKGLEETILWYKKFQER